MPTTEKPLLLEQQRRHRAVHPAAHAYKHSPAPLVCDRTHLAAGRAEGRCEGLVKGVEGDAGRVLLRRDQPKFAGRYRPG